MSEMLSVCQLMTKAAKPERQNECEALVQLLQIKWTDEDKKKTNECNREKKVEWTHKTRQ